MRQWKLNKITGPLFSIVLVLLIGVVIMLVVGCLLYTSPSPRDA